MIIFTLNNAHALFYYVLCLLLSRKLPHWNINFKDNHIQYMVYVWHGKNPDSI